MIWSHVICLGLVKTGTTSLSRALLNLNINTLDSRLHSTADINNSITAKIKQGSKKPLAGFPYKAYNDIGFCRKHYKYLFELDENIGFILTYRNSLDRLASAKRFYNKPINDYEFIVKHEKYHKEVLDFFGASPRLLIIQVCNGEGWDILCPFLGTPIPHKKFPHENKGFKKGYGR